ncbi:MAG TPA: Mut7-C RNAse domain-containing protein [Candidatus Sulfomarinibacteraceae bacterium]|nr:Mut7-C RNAse domain-containing protein [Candidatus Sulfomarinibacteraceae bacterium]
MKRATFRFYGELNEFLPPPRRQHPLSFPLNDRTSVKHPIESMGVPHTEVELILANSRPVDFTYLLQPGDYVSVYPPFHNLDISPLPALRPPLAPPVRFLLDVHLGRLATYLRLLGFDALYRNDYDDEELADLAAESGRVLLSRDRRLLMRKQVTYGQCLRTRDPRAQLEAVLRRFDLYAQIDPWQRCLACNGPLRPVPKEEVLHRLEPKTKRFYDEFHICEDCGKVYWKGSHYPRMRRFIARVRASKARAARDGHDR